MSKVIVIGIDSLMPSFVERFVREASLPNFAKIMQEGSRSKVIPQLPELTPTNWSTVATGAETRTHGVSCFFYHEHGLAPYELKSAFRSDVCKAEKLWQTAERFGKRSIIIEFPASYPPEAKGAIFIGDYGSPSRSEREITFSHCYTTLDLAGGDRVELRKAQGWKNVPGNIQDFLEFRMIIAPSEWEIGWPFTSREEIPDSKGVEYDVAVFRSGNGCGGYDTVAVCRGKDFSKSVAMLREGERSDFIVEDFLVNGQRVRAAFRMKLIELSPDAERLRLYLSEVYPVEGFTYPSELSPELVKHCGFYQPLVFQDFPIMKGWIDLQTFKEETEYTVDWLIKCVTYLANKEDWDLMMMKWHSPDHVNHTFWHLIDPICPKHDPGRVEEGWAIFRWNYQLVDKLVGSVLDCVGEDTFVVVVSDHGHIPHVRSIMMNDVLAEAGLLAWDSKDNIDWSRTQAYAQRLMYVYVNLEGREPTGIVKPSDFERVRERIIEVLLNLKDSETGTHPVNVALRNEDALALGVGGPTAGDVIYALRPGWGALDNRQRFGCAFPSPKDEPPAVWGHSHHGQNVGNAKISLGEIFAGFFVRGKGVKKGYVRENPMRMIDVAPTLARMLGISAPANCEGRAIEDIFEI